MSLTLTEMMSTIVEQPQKQTQQQQQLPKKFLGGGNKLGGNDFLLQIHTILKVATHNNHGNYISATAINCLLFGSKRLAKKVISKMLDYKLLRHVEEEKEYEKIAMNFLHMKSYPRNTYPIKKMISKIKKPLFAVTKKGEELLELLEQLTAICPSIDKPELMIRLQGVSEERLAPIRSYSR